MLVDQPPKNTVFPQRLREERHKRKLTQHQLSALCNFGLNQITRYELGDREPTLAGLYTIAEKLGVSADYLIGLIDDPYQQIVRVDLAPHEREIVDQYRREGWPGLFHLGADRIAK